MQRKSRKSKNTQIQQIEGLQKDFVPVKSRKSRKKDELESSFSIANPDVINEPAVAKNTTLPHRSLYDETVEETLLASGALAWADLPFSLTEEPQVVGSPTNLYTVLPLNTKEEGETSPNHALGIDAILKEFPTMPEQPPAPPSTLLFTSEQNLKLESVLSNYLSREELDEDVRFLLEGGFAPEQVVEIITKHAHLTVQALKDKNNSDITNLDKFKELRFSNDLIFKIIQAKSFIAVKIIQTNFVAFKNSNLSPEQLLEIILDDPFVEASSMPKPAKMSGKLSPHAQEVLVKTKAKPAYRKGTFNWVNVVPKVKGSDANFEPTNPEHAKRGAVHMVKEGRSSKSRKIQLDKEIDSYRKVLLTKSFTREMLDKIALIKDGSARIEILYRNCNALLGFGFSSTQLYQIISPVNANPIVLDVLRDSAPSLNKYLQLNASHLFELAFCPNSLNILDSLRNCMVELFSFNFKPEHIMQLVKLPNAAAAIDMIKLNYVAFSNAYLNKNPDVFSLLPPIKPAVVPDLIINLVTLGTLSPNNDFIGEKDMVPAKTFFQGDEPKTTITKNTSQSEVMHPTSYPFWNKMTTGIPPQNNVEDESLLAVTHNLLEKTSQLRDAREELDNGMNSLGRVFDF